MGDTMKHCLLMCCHNRFGIVPDGFTPIQCGAVLNPALHGAAGDDEGDNISAENRSYCELTAHYYAWKNIDADVYGFCHYRRFFGADDRAKKPYIVCRNLTGKAQLLSGDEHYLEQLFKKYDLIAPKSENMGLSVRSHYCTSEYHFEVDLELFVELLETMRPDYKAHADNYLSQNRQYFCNMFIMKKADFYEYCSTLFPVLAEFDKRKTLHGDFQSDRTDGYLGEIFTGIFITKKREQGARIGEFSRIDAECTRKKIMLYHLLPPESERRFVAKRLVKRIKRQNETKT